MFLVLLAKRATQIFFKKNLIDRQRQVYMWSNKKASVVARELNEISMAQGWMRRFL
jgi:hypothetical protein